MSDVVLRGDETIMLVAMAIRHEIERLIAVIEGTQFQDDQADALNALVAYRAILLQDLGQPG